MLSKLHQKKSYNLNGFATKTGRGLKFTTAEDRARDEHVGRPTLMLNGCDKFRENQTCIFREITTSVMNERTNQPTNQLEASISTRILGPDPTTFEAYMVHPIVNPTKFWKGVGDSSIKPWRPRQKFVTTSGDFPTQNTCKCVGGRGEPRAPLGGAYSTPPDLAEFGG